MQVTFPPALLALSLLALPLEAQTLRPSKATLLGADELATPVRFQGPPAFAHLDLDTGVVTQSTLAPSARSAQSLCFDNTLDDEPIVDGLLYPAKFELLDWGVKSCGGSGFVDRLTIGYGSMAVPTAAGGPGGSLTVRIYSSATGFGAPGTLVREIKLTGLPSQGPITGPGQFGPQYVTVDLGARSFFLPEGPIGWSYQGDDGGTAPILVDVDASLGTEMAYDVYSPGPASAATYGGTFLLPAGPNSWDAKENSFYLQLFQNDAVASVLPIPAGSNPDLFTAAAPVVGSRWRSQVGLVGGSGSGVTLVAMSSSRLNGVQSPMGELVIDPSTLITEVSVGVFDAHSFSIPSDSALLGWRFYAQGGFFDAGGLQLTNGLELTVGSF